MLTRRELTRAGMMGALVALALAVWCAPASACSPRYGFHEPIDDCTRTGLLPPNAVLTAAERATLDEAAPFDVDPRLTARMTPCPEPASLLGDLRCKPFWRLRAGASAGTKLHSRDQNPYACPVDATIDGEADATPPARPVLADVVVDLKLHSEEDEGCSDCGDTDVVTLFITNVADDRAERGQMFVALYVAPTAEEAAMRKTIDHLVAVEDASHVGVSPLHAIDGGPAAAIRAAIGPSANRRRFDEGLSHAGPICVAIETMDRAGNLSARSDAVCFDGTNEADPRVRTSEGDTGGCAITMRPRLGTLAVALVVAVALALRLGRKR